MFMHPRIAIPMDPDPTVATARDRIVERVQGGPAADQAALLQDTATAIRRSVLEMIGRAGMGHVGGDLSVTDILTTLFFGTLRIDPRRPDWPERDRFVLSKGHCSASLYATLAHSGFFPRDALDSFMAPLSPLNGHPDRTKVPGVETNTGPLGHGLPVAVGCALAARLAGSDRRTYVVVGDGELQEGSNWEAAMAAGHHGLGTLTAVCDRNGLQQGARTESTNRLDPLGDRFASFGWEVTEVPGHDHVGLLEALAAQPGDRPRLLLAQTTKGKGVSFMEDRVEWHHKVPDADQIEAALAELAA